MLTQTKKKRIIYSLLLLNCLSYAPLDIHLPALPNITSQLETSKNYAKLIFVWPYIMTIFMRLFWGAQCDIIGRRKVMIYSTIISFIGQTLCAFAHNMPTLILFRTIHYLGMGSTQVVCITIICDFFQGQTRARMIALIEMTLPLILVIAPILGGTITEISPHSWRYNFIILSVLQLLTLPIILYLPETLTKAKKKLPKNIFQNIKKVLTNYPFFLTGLMISCVNAPWMLFFTHAPFIYQDCFCCSPTEYACYQALPVIFYFIGVFIYSLYVPILGIKNLFFKGLYLYFIFGIINIFYILKILPLEPLSMIILISIEAFATSFIFASGMKLALDFIDKSNIGSASGIMGSMIRLLSGFFMLISILIIKQNILPILWIMEGIFLLSIINYFLLLPFLKSK